MCLLTRVQLRQKQVDVPLVCPMCDLNPETILHIFVTFNYTSSCWSYVAPVVDLSTPDSFGSWLALLFDKNDS